MRSSLLGGALVAIALAGVLLAGDEPRAAAPPAAFVVCELAYTEVIAFDYDRDGTRDRVQFWLIIEAHPASGEPGTAGAVPESGSVRYFVYDVERKRRIDDWLMGFNMGFPSPASPTPSPTPASRAARPASTSAAPRGRSRMAATRGRRTRSRSRAAAARAKGASTVATSG